VAEADRTVAAVAVAEADCTAAEAEAGCTDQIGAWAVPDWMRRCGFDHRHFVLQNVVEPREPV